MNPKIPIIVLTTFAILASLNLASTTCPTNTYLTIFNNNPANASVGIDNLSLKAYFTKFIYSNSSGQCVFHGIPHQSISFYVTSSSSSSWLYNSLYSVGTFATNSAGYAVSTYNSSKVGVGSFSAIARWYGNSTSPSTQTNNVSVKLVSPVGALIANCTSGCSPNVNLGTKFTMVARLCVGRPPFSWNNCIYIPNQRIIFNASNFYFGTAYTNITGSANITYNTSQLGFGTYELYAIWRGGPKFGNLSLSSFNNTYNINVLAPTSSTTSAGSTSTTTVQSTTTSTGNQTSTTTQSNNTWLYVLVTIIFLLLITLFVKHEIDLKKMKYQLRTHRH